MLDSDVEEFKAKAFYLLKDFLNMDTPEDKKDPFYEPLLDEEDETYIALVLGELAAKVKHAALLEHNERIMKILGKEIKGEKEKLEEAKLVLEKFGYSRKEIDERLKGYRDGS